MNRFWHMQIHPSTPQEAKYWALKAIKKKRIGLDIGLNEEELSSEDRQIWFKMKGKALDKWEEDEWKKWDEWKKFQAGPPSDTLKDFISKNFNNTIVLLRAGAIPIALVEVISPYYFESEPKDELWFRHRRKITVLDTYENFERNYLEEFKTKYGNVSIASRGTLQKVFQGKTYKFIKFWISKIQEEMSIKHIEKLLIDFTGFHQIILYGPPGTGKTYFAKKVTAKLLDLPPEAGVDKKHPQHEEFKNARFGENKSSNAKGKWSIVQFHPSYNYEDFVRGIKIIPKGEGISYESVNKIFAKMCKEARKNSEENYVLLIDEINRANLAAVLGELIYALEYRGEAVDTPYEVNDDSKLIVPPNLYIIGTMNTADRSIGHIDYAVRRRFAFVQILPEENVIEQHYDNEEVKKVALTLFNTVKELFDEKNGYLSPDYHKEDVQIGHSYFIVDTSKEVEDQIEELAYKFSYQVFPLLKEYYKDGVLVPKEENIKLKELDVSVTESIKPEELLKKIKNFFSLQISDLLEDDEEE